MDKSLPRRHDGRKVAAANSLAGTGLTIGLTVVQAVVVVPLCLTHIGPELYGRWLAAAEFFIWLQLLDAGVPTLLVQRVGALAGRGRFADAARWSSTVLVVLAVLAASLAGLMVAAAPFVAAYLEVLPADRATFVAAFRLGVVAAVGLMLANIGLGLASALQRTRWLSGALVAAAALSLVLSVVLLLAGWGVWALSVALLSRMAVSVVAAVLFVVRLPQTGASWWRSPSPKVLRDIVRLAPYTSMASLGHLAANNSEVLLVAMILGPVPALAYALTRRAFDGARQLLDAIVWAVAGGFSHLAAAPDRHRARSVLSDIAWARFAVAAVVLATVVAINQPLVTLLFGASHYAGPVLTLAFALHLMLSGQSFLAGYLWRSTGHVREGSIAIGAGGVARVAGMALGLAWVGLVGAPLAAAVVSVATLAWAWRGLDASLPAGEASSPSLALRWVPVIVLAVASTLALAPLPATWPTVVFVAAVVGGLGSASIFLVLPAGTVPVWMWRAKHE